LTTEKQTWNDEGENSLRTFKMIY